MYSVVILIILHNIITNIIVISFKMLMKSIILTLLKLNLIILVMFRNNVNICIKINKIKIFVIQKKKRSFLIYSLYIICSGMYEEVCEITTWEIYG